ncbi:hypothetical protein K8I61_01535 [bacterium]|nr:hypothetical protein [bacterium]
MESELTREERQFQKMSAALVAIFAIALFLFMFVPEYIVKGNNAVGRLFDLPDAPVVKDIYEGTTVRLADPAGGSKNVEVHVVAERGYLAVACSLLTLLAAIFLGCYANPRKYMDYMPIVLFAKAAASFYSILFFFMAARYLQNLAIAIVDIPLLLVIAIFWSRARRARDHALAYSG